VDPIRRPRPAMVRRRRYGGRTSENFGTMSFIRSATQPQRCAVVSRKSSDDTNTRNSSSPRFRRGARYKTTRSSGQINSSEGDAVRRHFSEVETGSGDVADQHASINNASVFERLPKQCVDAQRTRPRHDQRDLHDHRQRRQTSSKKSCQ